MASPVGRGEFDYWGAVGAMRGVGKIDEDKEVIVGLKQRVRELTDENDALRECVQKLRDDNKALHAELEADRVKRISAVREGLGGGGGSAFRAHLPSKRPGEGAVHDGAF